MSVAFARRLWDFGDRPAFLLEGGAEISYRDLAARVAARRLALGRTRHLILWEARVGLDSLVTYLAALAGGHPVIATAPGDAALVDTYHPTLVARGGELIPCPAADDKACHPDLSLLLSTSGSTGSPKLVRLSAGNLDSNAGSIAAYQHLTPDDRAALILPLHYSYGLSVLHAHLRVGAAVDLATPAILAPGFLEHLQAARLTNLAGVPYSYQLLEQVGFRVADLPSLRFMSVAGGRLAPDLVRLYAGHLARRGAELFVMYGQTEATARIAYLPPAAALQQADCIGDVIPGGALSLRDGELIYRGPNVMMGYAEHRRDLAHGAELAELATGDLAERTEAGYYRIIGRRSRFSKIAGLRIGHDSLERQGEARGFSLAVTGNDERLQVACVSVPQDVDPLRGEIAALAGLTPAFIELRLVEALPRRSNGKIDYPALKALFQDMPAAPGSVLAAFQESFAPRAVRPGDSFVGLGGDSLSFVQLSLALEQILGHLPPQWERQSIAALSAAAKAETRPARRWPDWLMNWHREWRPLDANLFMRALAILFIVLHHATMWEIAGGAATLMMLAGYNVARFHSGRLLAGFVGDFLVAVWRPLLLYYAVLMGYCFYTGDYPWQSLLLLGNLGINGYSTLPTPLVAYWFIEAYAQIMLLMGLAFALPIFRRAVAPQPFAAGLVFLAGSILLREIQPQLWDAGEMKPFVSLRVLYLAALGWCIYFADSRGKRLLMTGIIVALLLALPTYEGAKATILWVRAGVLIGSAVVLLWWANVALPRQLAALLAAVAGASYSIYLFHNVPFFLWLEDAGLPRMVEDGLHIVLGLGLGFAVHHLVLHAGRLVRNADLTRHLWRRTNARRLAPGE